MKVSKMSEGKLVYVPSDVTLFTIDEQGAAKKIIKLNKPINLLVTKTNENTYEVLYENEIWLVKKSKTYKVNND
jgi:hypothetical protein